MNTQIFTVGFDEAGRGPSRRKGADSLHTLRKMHKGMPGGADAYGA